MIAEANKWKMSFDSLSDHVYYDGSDDKPLRLRSTDFDVCFDFSMDSGASMKFSYSTNVFRARPLIEAIEGIAKAGFCAVEIVADRPHAFPEELSAAAVAQLNQCLADKKIKVCNLNSSVVTAMSEVINPSWLEENWQHREIRIRYTLDCLRLAAAMGVPTISTNAGGEIPRPWIAKMPGDCWWPTYIASCRLPENSE